MSHPLVMLVVAAYAVAQGFVFGWYTRQRRARQTEAHYTAALGRATGNDFDAMLKLFYPAEGVARIATESHPLLRSDWRLTWRDRARRLAWQARAPFRWIARAFAWLGGIDLDREDL